jgi:hypothetical protein
MVARRRAVCLVLAVLGGLCLLWASGVVFWLTLGVVMVGLAGVLLPVQSRRARFAPIALVIGSMTVGLALLEFALWLWEAVSYEPLPAFDAETADVPLAPDLPPEIRAKIARMQSAVIMPPTWQKRDLAKLPGTNPYMWHGVLHHIDANGMRREEPFAPRDPSRFRIMVVGDSFAYGQGIDAYWAYPAQLERALAPDFRVEVLNLGVRGYASENILDVLRRFVPALEPDLAVYGVCLNDFLERGTGQPSLPPAQKGDEGRDQAHPGRPTPRRPLRRIDAHLGLLPWLLHPTPR